MSQVFFTSDTHAFHKNITRGVSTWEKGVTPLRDFDNEVLMTEHMAEVINSVVGPNDILYHCGDWSFSGKDKIKIFRDMLNCKTINLILGNHDYRIKRNEDHQKLFNKIYPGRMEKKICGTLMTLSHHAQLVWQGEWQIFAHSHGSLNNWINTHMPQAKMIDVGVDCHDFRPWSMEELHEVLDCKGGDAIDHHDTKTKNRG